MNTTILVRLKQYVAMVGLFGVLAFSVALPVFADDSAINTAILGGESETYTLLNKFEPGGYNRIVTPGTLVYNVIAIVLGLLGVLCVVMMMYGGFLWITAGGEEDKAKKGTTILFQAVVGAIIVFAAYTVTYFVLVQLGNVVIK